MPSSFKFREAIGLRPKLDRSLQSKAAVRKPAQTTTVLPRTAISVADNIAFDDALQQHLKKLDPAERDAFKAAYQIISPQDLLSKVKEFDNMHSEKVTFRRCTEPISKFLGFLEQFMQGVSIGIQSNPEISSLVVGAVRIVIDLSVRFFTFFIRLTDMMIRLSDHLEHLAEYADTSREVKLIRTAEANIYGDLLDFCRQARYVFVNKEGIERKWTSIRVFIRIQWEPFEASFGAIDSSLRHHLEVLLYSAQALQLNAIQHEKRDADLERRRVHRKESIEERRGFLHWISANDFEDDHDTIFAKRYPGTGAWLIQRIEFQQWFDGQKSALLWCFGKPGAGKSVLASTVLEHITSQHALNDQVGIAYAYFKYDSPILHRPSPLVSMFIKQLCWKKKQIPQHLLDFYHTYDQDARTPAFGKYKDSFFKLARSYDQIFLVIDALDECIQNQREQIIDFISDLTKDLSCAKVFVTSRSETDIVEAFTRQQTLTIQIEAENVVEDIKAFAKGRVDDLVKLNKLKLKDSALKEIIAQTLVTQAEGMFLWVNLQLENLCRQRSDRDIMKELSSLPHDLDKTYVRIIHQINQQPEALQVLAQKCLIWVVHAVRPLQTEELIDAVAVEDSSTMRSDLHRYPKEVILEVCANLLVEENQFIRPIHYSVQEYFTKPPKGVIDSHCSKYFTAFEHAQAQLAKSCLLYLMLDFLAKGPCQDSSDLQERLLNYPFAWYSSQFFDKHIQCLGEVTGDILERLNMFLSSTGNTLSAVLQLRRLRNGHDPIIVTKDFDPFSWPINAATVIYATALYDLPCLHREDSKWMKLKVPKYTLHLASSGGSLDAVNRLLELGHSIHDQDESGATPLYYASANGHERIVRPLLDGGAEINAQGGRFGTALQAASIRGHDQIVKLLLKNGAQVNLRVGRYGNALQAASVDGHNRIVQRLLDNGAEINDQGGRYGNALQAASANGYDEIVQLLLKKGADVNAEGGRYGNALQAASFAGHNQIVEQLLTKGANVKAHGGRYGYALQAASRYGYVQVVQVLIESGADVNAQGGQFGNALQAASRYGHEKVIQLLLKNGALNSADQSQ